MNIRIYQINLGRDEKRIAFQGLDALKQLQEIEEISSSIYDCVFSGKVNCSGLEDVFQKFNIDHPDGYSGRSLSVSDVVEIVDAEDVGKGFYYCDNVGFSKVDFDPEEAEPYKGNKIRVLMVEPGKKAYEKEIGTGLQNIYAALDCTCFEPFCPYEDNVMIVCDEEHKINGSRPNRAIYDENGKMIDLICGKFFICDCSTSSMESLPDDMMEKYKKQFLLPERFCKFNGEILAVKYDPSKEAAR